MSPGERKFGKNPSHPLPVWSGLIEHREKIGPAIWEFLWLIDKITVEDNDGIGWCLGGKASIKTERVAADLKESYDTAKVNLKRLEDLGYIIRRRKSVGYVIGVLNSRKFGLRKGKSDSGKTRHHETVIAEKPAITPLSDSGKTRQVIAGKPAIQRQYRGQRGGEEAAAPVSALKDAWKVLGVKLPIGHVRFQGEWESFYSHDHDGPVVDVMERFIQCKQTRGQRDIPRKFYDLKHELEKFHEEVEAAQKEVQVKEVRELEDEPWMQQTK